MLSTYLKSVFGKLPLMDLAHQELEDAQRELLRARSYLEDAEANVSSREARVARLVKFVGANDTVPVKVAGGDNVST